MHHTLEKSVYTSCVCKPKANYINDIRIEMRKKLLKTKKKAVRKL